jgi:flagellar assembly factor FliW
VSAAALTSESCGTTPGPTLTVPSRVLGSLTLPAEALLTFPEGIFGFPEHRRFALLQAAQGELYWLQSVDDPDLTFLLADPFHYFPGYALDLPPDDAFVIQVTNLSDVVILAIVTLGRGGESATANLQGPVAINPRTHLGRQLVINGPGADVRAPLELTVAGR